MQGASPICNDSRTSWHLRTNIAVRSHSVRSDRIFNFQIPPEAQ